MDEDEVVERIKKRLQSHGRSLKGDARTTFGSASRFTIAQAREIAAQWQTRLSGRQFTDSSELLSADRGR